uniref:Methyltransferase domain-containing protein n=1 Tax=Ignisphaera aggregans TaxID=334771 RepID=A0A7C4BCY8_9CREN
MVMRSKKELEVLLSKVPGFPAPKRNLEQYVCDSRVASEMLWHAYMSGDIENKVVVDLGCGTGILAYGALLLGAATAFCIDIDCNALAVARDFLRPHDNGNALFICLDIRKMALRSADTVIMNPPFGIYRHGMDMMFLASALDLKPRVIYTIHKHSDTLISTIEKVLKKYKEDYRISILLTGVMAIPQVFETHVKKVHRFDIAMIKIEKNIR